MLYRDGRFVSASIAESSLLALTFLSAIAQVGLDTALAGLIGTGSVRGHAPWSFFLATALASSWAIALVFLGSSFFRLVRFLDAHHHTLKDSRSALVLPLGAESLAAALGSAFLSAAVVWVAQGVHDASPGVSDSERFGQFDIYFPIAIGFQILALPGFVRLADIFSYAQSKAKRELENTLTRVDKINRKADLSSVSTGGSLISAESIKAAQKELEQAKARIERRERSLASVSTGGSAQSILPQRAFNRPSGPLVHGEDRHSYRERPASAQGFERGEQFARAVSARQGEQQRDTIVDIFSTAPVKRSWL